MSEFVYDHVVIANLVAMLILVLCWRTKTVGRFTLVLLFLCASLYNFGSAFVRPEEYTAHARLAYFTWYQRFILDVFTRHTTAVVAIIAICQLVIAVLMALRGRLVHVGLLAAVVDLLAIAPLGSTAAFPVTLIVAWAAVILLFRDYPLTMPEDLDRMFKHHREATA